MDKNIYIHMGPGKTGTKAIQKVLASEEDYLRRNGYCCIVAGKDLNCNARDDKSKINKLIKNADMDNIVLSWEGYGFRRNFPLLKEIFEPFVSDNLRFIFYIRRQDKRLESWYQFSVNKNQNTEGMQYDDFFVSRGLDFPRLIKGEDVDDSNFLLHYKAFLDDISGAFPRSTIIARPYYEPQRTEWDITYDFFDSIGISEQAPETRRINCTLNMNANEILRHVLMYAVEHKAVIQNRLLHRELSKKSIFQASSGGRSKCLFPDHERKLIVGMFNDSNAEIFEKYGLGEEEFQQWNYYADLKGEKQSWCVDQSHLSLAESLCDYFFNRYQKKHSSIWRRLFRRFV